MTDRGEAVTFETPEDVALSFELAGPGSRLAAAMIDHAIVAVFVLAAQALLLGLGGIAFSFTDLFDTEKLAQLGFFAVAMLLALIFGSLLFYYVAGEWLFSGQSVGKRVLGLRVVREGGYAVSLTASLLRNVMRLVDVLPTAYFAGLLSITLSREHKRLGDHLAGTLVIRLTHAEKPRVWFAGERHATITDRRFVLSRDHVHRLDREVLILLEGYFARIETIDEERARTLRSSMAQSLATRMQLDVAVEDDASAAALLKETYLALRERLEAG